MSREHVEEQREARGEGPPGERASAEQPKAEPTPTASAEGADAVRGSRFARIGAALHTHVDRELHARHAPKGTMAAKIEDRLKRRAARLWGELKRHPSVGIVLSGAIGLALATAAGPAELLVAVSAAYAAYLVLRKNLSAEEAIEKTVVPLEH